MVIHTKYNGRSYIARFPMRPGMETVTYSRCNHSFCILILLPKKRIMFYDRSNLTVASSIIISLSTVSMFSGSIMVRSLSGELSLALRRSLSRAGLWSW